MLVKGFLRRSFIGLTLLGTCLLNAAYALDPSPNSKVSDVKLGEKGRLEGQVVDRQGHALPNVSVALKADGIEPVVTTSRHDGRFAYEGVPGGVYQVAARNGDSATIRAWTTQAAPPTAQVQAVLYTEPIADPGTATAASAGNAMAASPQNVPYNSGHTAPRNGAFKRIISNPIVIPAAIATAIAVPVALNNTRRSPASP